MGTKWSSSANGPDQHQQQRPHRSSPASPCQQQQQSSWLSREDQDSSWESSVPLSCHRRSCSFDHDWVQDVAMARQGQGPKHGHRPSSTTSMSPHRQQTSHGAKARCESQSISFAAASLTLGRKLRALLRKGRPSTAASRRCSEHRKFFRENFYDCPHEVLVSLAGYYEALRLKADLEIMADKARPVPKSLSMALQGLLEAGTCSDVVLRHRNKEYYVHKCLLQARSPYFAILLEQHDAEISLPDGFLMPHQVQALLHFIYMGKHSDEAEMQDVIRHFQIVADFPHDIRNLIISNVSADCILVFGEGQSEGRTACHKAVLAARSNYFRSLFRSKSLLSVCQADSNSSIPLRLSLDTSIIPSEYSQVLVQAFYTDDPVSLELITRRSSSRSHNNPHTSEQDAPEKTPLGHLMTLYEMAQFLEFDSLWQRCEDQLLELLTLDNAHEVLPWSCQSHGSDWLQRQIFQFLLDNANAVATKLDLVRCIDDRMIIKILENDQAQASEVELLYLLCTWVDIHLNNREPRKSKRFDRYDDHLVSPFLSSLRIGHILPLELEVVDSTLRRRFTPELAAHKRHKFSFWDTRNLDGLYIQPRLYAPYIKECKKLLDDRTANEGGFQGKAGSLPDALYMLHDENAATSVIKSNVHCQIGNESCPTVPQMLERAQFLLNSLPVDRMVRYQVATRQEIAHLVQLRIVRECNLTDTYTNVLKKAANDSAGMSGQGGMAEFHSGAGRAFPGTGLSGAQMSPPMSMLRMSSSANQGKSPDILGSTASADYPRQ